MVTVQINLESSFAEIAVVIPMFRQGSTGFLSLTRMPLYDATEGVERFWKAGPYSETTAERNRQQDCFFEMCAEIAVVIAMLRQVSAGFSPSRQDATVERREGRRAFDRGLPMLTYSPAIQTELTTVPKLCTIKYLIKPSATVSTAIYARVSTTDQNCESQLRELREYCERRGWNVVGEFVDTGFSGAKASRPALDALMKAAALRKFSCVAVYKIDRAGRSVLHLSQLLAALESYGIRFVAISQGLDTDASNPTSKLLTGILSCVAEFERELLRERTLSGIRAAQAAGKHVGRPKRIFRRDEVVRLRDEEGWSWRRIAEELQIPTMTAVAAYRELQAGSECTETFPEKMHLQPVKTQRRKRAS